MVRSGPAGSTHLESIEDAALPIASAPRQPGGLLGTMHTHADFDAPLAEEFLIP